jgi:hypothetical protein
MSHFLIKHIPATPHLVIQTIIGLARGPGESTIAQLITNIVNAGYPLSVDSAEAVATSIGYIAQEARDDVKTIAGSLLVLALRCTKADRRNNVINFMMNFLASDNTEELVVSIAASGHCPIFAGDTLPTTTDFSNSQEEWLRLAEGLIAVLTRSDMYDDRKNAREAWMRVNQRNSVSEYIAAEQRAFARLSQLNSLLGFENPTTTARAERLLENLNDATKDTLYQMLKMDGIRTETLSYSEVVKILDELNSKMNLKYTWYSKAPAVRFAPSTTVLRSNPTHLPHPTIIEENVQKDKPIIPISPRNFHSIGGQSPRSSPSTSPKNRSFPGRPSPSLTPMESPSMGRPGSTPRSAPGSNRPEDVREPNDPKDTKSPKSMHNEKEPDGSRSPYNLRPRKTNLPSFSITTTQSYPPTPAVKPVYVLEATVTSSGRKILVALDSCSSVSMISPQLAYELMEPAAPLTLSGVGGPSNLDGSRGKCTIRVRGNEGIEEFSVTGFISDAVPRGAHILLGTPTLLAMGLEMSYAVPLTAKITSQFKLTVPLKPLRVDDRTALPILPCDIENDGRGMVKLPMLTFEVDEEVLKMPYQCRKEYGVPHSLREAASREILSEIQAGHLKEVEYSADFWISPLFIKQKVGKFDAEGHPKVRLLADLKLLNQYTRTPKYWSSYAPDISNFPDFLQATEDSHFTLLDISNAYHTCLVHPAVRRFLVVRFDNRLFQYVTCPQGLAASAAFWPIHITFLMNSCLGEDWCKWAKVYIDDILIHGSSSEECARRTALVLDCLTKYGKPISDKSTRVPQREIDCLGLEFSARGFRLSESSIEKLRRCLDPSAFPKTSKQMRAVIGSIQYAHIAFSTRNHPRSFAELMAPLYDTIKTERFKMSDEATASLNTLESLITNETMLYPNPATLIDDDHILVICCDASDKATGAAIFRCKGTAERIIEHPDTTLSSSESTLLSIDYHILNSTEKRWFTFENECFSIVRALIKWRSLLCSAVRQYWPVAKIVVLTDSMTTLAGWKKPSEIPAATAKSRRFSGWASEVAFISFLPIKFAHIDGNKNCLADLLSRISRSLMDDCESDDTMERMDEHDAVVWHLSPSIANYGGNEGGPELSEDMTDNEHYPDDLRFHHLPLDEDSIARIAASYCGDRRTFAHGLSLADIYAHLTNENAHQVVSNRAAVVVNGKFFACKHPNSEAHVLLYTRSSFQIVDGDRDLTNRLVLVIPETPRSEPLLASVDPLHRDGVTLREELLVLSHEAQGHCGQEKSAIFLRQICWWPSLLQDVSKHVMTCQQCAGRRSSSRAAGYQVIASERFSFIFIDHKALPESITNVCSVTAVLSIVDSVSGYAKFSPVTSYSAAETAYALFVDWIKTFGIPVCIQSDNSTVFMSDVLKELCKLLGIKQIRITCMTPTANGRIERKHKDLNRWLESSTNLIFDDKSLVFYLALAEMDCNHLSNAFLITYGASPRTLPMALCTTEDSESPDEIFDEEIIRKIRDVTIANSDWKKLLLEKKARYNAILADARNNGLQRLKTRVNEGDIVLYSGKEYRVVNLKFGANKELPTSVSLQDPTNEGAAPFRAKYELIRPLPTATAVPAARLPHPVPEIGSFVFYEVDLSVFAGRVIGLEAEHVFIHLHTPNREQTIYHPTWWMRNNESSDSEWTVVRHKHPPSERAKPVVHIAVSSDIIASGPISAMGRPSNAVFSQLHARGVFQVSGGH